MFDDEVVQCPGCGQCFEVEIAYLGSLGNRNHYRCPYCGVDFSEEVEEER